MTNRRYHVAISKVTAQPGELTTVAGTTVGDIGDLRQVIGRAGRAIDWRVRTENERVLERTRRRLRKLGLRIPGF